MGCFEHPSMKGQSVTRDEIIANKHNLSGASMYGADLNGADLNGAKLNGANLSAANLHGARLANANLCGADLRWSNLSFANLNGADLSITNLCESNLYGACMNDTDLTGARLPHFQIPGGTLIVWGKKNGVMVKMAIPVTARRTACLINRKCRAESAVVLDVENDDKEITVSNRWGDTVYAVRQTVTAHDYDDNPALDCAPGIHFWLTRQEAEQW